jgi:hypothetical protein
MTNHNHVHRVLRTGEESLSRGMQNLGFRYIRHVDTQRKRVGHFFKGRYKAMAAREQAVEEW